MGDHNRRIHGKRSKAQIEHIKLYVAGIEPDAPRPKMIRRYWDKRVKAWVTVFEARYC